MSRKCHVPANRLSGFGTTAIHPARRLLQKVRFANRLGTENRVLEGLCGAKTNNGFRLDLDRFARLRIAAHARLAVRLHDASDVRNDELAGAALGFLDRQLEQFFKELRGDLLGSAHFFGDVRDNLGLAQWFCHLVSFSSSELRLRTRRHTAKRASRARRALYGRWPRNARKNI